jgi:ribosomal protein RSM22 (predicted rRNA methylase)
LAAKLGCQDIHNDRQQHRDIFKFLERHAAADAAATLVLQDVLLGFSSESNIRSVIARLLCEGAPGARALIAERTTRRNFAALQRAMRCLGLGPVNATEAPRP